MSQRYIDLLISSRPGVLARLIGPLSKAGLTIQRQDLGDSVGAHRKLRIELTPGGEVPADLRQLIESVDGVESFEALVEPPPSNEVLQEMLRDAFQKVNEEDDPISIVRPFGPNLPSELRAKCLTGLGRKIGNGIYRREFALGSPLRLDAALQRIVIPSLTSFLPARLAGDNVIEIDPCPLCDARYQTASCSYAAGVIQGLLELAKLTSKARVTETECSHGTSSSRCAFAIAE